MRQFAEITFDARHALGLGHRTNVVENDAGDRAWIGDAKQHCQNAAAGTADKDRRPNPKLDENADDVTKLDGAIVVGVISIVIGLSAAARVDRHDVPGR